VVNLASRLCDHAADDEILLDRRAFLDAEVGIVADAPREAWTSRASGRGSRPIGYALCSKPRVKQM